MVTGLLDKGSLKHSNSAEVSIPLGGQESESKPGGPASTPGTLELPGSSSESEPAAPQFQFEKGK